ncbi:hypothetical protein C6P40_004529, partial [Pichia californica]
MPKIVTTNKGTEFKNLAVITYDSFLTGSNRILIRMDSAPTGKKDYNLIAERAFSNHILNFTVKLDSTKKARLMTIDRKTIGHKDPDASSPMADTKPLFSLLLKYTHTPNLKLAAYYISNTFLNSPVTDNILVVNTPVVFKEEPAFKNSSLLQVMKYVCGLNRASLRFHKRLTTAMKKLYESMPG